METFLGEMLASLPGISEPEYMAELPPLPWVHCFVDPDNPSQPATIQLRQVTRKLFILSSSLEYTGETGVPSLPAEARVLRPQDLGDPALTDLASVPAVLRWFVSSYGVHTPAALLHDRLIGSTSIPGVSDADADRFFRFMLKSLGVRFVRRWMMWTAVAFGTRWRNPRLRPLLLLWLVLAVAGMAALVYGLLAQSWWFVIAAVIAPLLAAVLWGRQYGAGLTAAATAVWVLPPTILATIGFWFYWLMENAVSLLPVHTSVKGDEPVQYKQF